MIGSGIKGLIHYLFSYGHFREVPTLCVCVCVCICGPLISKSPLYVANCSSWQTIVISRKASKDCKHQRPDRLFPSEGLTSHPGAVVTIFQRDLHLITQIKKCANWF